MTDTQKILAEFESLYEDQKEILDRPVCCTRKDCLCSKVTVWEHLKDFLATSNQEARAEERARVVGEIEKKKKYWPIWGSDTSPAEGDTSRKKDRNEGYNQAIDDLITSLEKPLTDKD